MKSILQKKMLSLAFSVFTVLGIAQCPTVTSITSSYGANGTITLTALSSGTVSPTSLLLWSYGGSATYISGNNPVVVRYAANGYYNICASYSACPSSNFCKADSISNVSTSTVSPCPAGVTSINAVNGANGTVTLTALSGGSISSTPTGVTWNYSPAIYVSGNNPVVVNYTTNGTYSICASYSTCPSSNACIINSISNISTATTSPCPVLISISSVNGANGTVTLTALSGTNTPGGPLNWNYGG